MVTLLEPRTQDSIHRTSCCLLGRLLPDHHHHHEVHCKLHTVQGRNLWGQALSAWLGLGGEEEVIGPSLLLGQHPPLSQQPLHEAEWGVAHVSTGTGKSAADG